MTTEHASRLRCPRCKRAHIREDRAVDESSTTYKTRCFGTSGAEDWEQTGCVPDAPKERATFYCLDCGYKWLVPDWFDGTLRPVKPCEWSPAAALTAEKILETTWPKGRPIVVKSVCGNLSGCRGEVRGHGQVVVYVRLDGERVDRPFYPNEISLYAGCEAPKESAGPPEVYDGEIKSVQAFVVGTRVRWWSPSVPSHGFRGAVAAIDPKRPNFLRVRWADGDVAEKFMKFISPPSGLPGIVTEQEFDRRTRETQVPFERGDCVNLRNVALGRIPGFVVKVDGVVAHVRWGGGARTIPCKVSELRHEDRPRKSGWKKDPYGDPRIVPGATVLLCETRFAKIAAPGEYQPEERDTLREGWVGAVVKVDHEASDPILVMVQPSGWGAGNYVGWPRRNCIFICGPDEE